MIQAINDYIAAQLAPIKIGENHVQVYPVGDDRDDGLSVYPHFAISLATWLWDLKRARPHHEVFTPAATTQTVPIASELGHLFAAKIAGTIEGPFVIVTGTNDALKFRTRIGTEWRSAQEVVLPAGTLDAFEIARILNWSLEGIEAWAEYDRLVIQTSELGGDIEILDVSMSAYATLGFSIGIYSHLDRTGPASWIRKRYPTPIKLFYQIDLRSSDLTQQQNLLRILPHAIPTAQEVVLEDRQLLFLAVDPQVLDDLSKPLYWTAFRWWVHGAWIDDITEYQSASITDPQLEFDG